MRASASSCATAAFSIACACACVFGAPPRVGAATPTLVDPSVVAPIDALVRGIDRGDATAVTLAYVDAPTITDEFAPFAWHGAGAAGRWNAGFVRMLRTGRIDRVRVTHGRPTYVATTPHHAWLVVPTTFAYRASGAMQHETAAWTFALVRTADRWRIVTSTWAKTSDTAS